MMLVKLNWGEVVHVWILTSFVCPSFFFVFLTHFLPGLTGLHVHPHAKRDIQSELGKSRLANAHDS